MTESFRTFPVNAEKLRCPMFSSS